MINLFSTSHYEWMLESGDIDYLCQLPSGGRYTAEPIVFLIPSICLLLLIKK
ncbi:YjeO family protein [Gilliamella apicola]|uniref:YjeO family protein n=1 Tax=Gilliamella sp. App4-10 TaxID=3120231 RepID=UPI001C401150